jgi:hypothetical protein
LAARLRLACPYLLIIEEDAQMHRGETIILGSAHALLGLLILVLALH